MINRANEFFETPAYITESSMLWLKGELLFSPGYFPTNILDIGAGTGAWGRAAKKRFPNAKITGIDIRHTNPDPAIYDHWHVLDFTQVKTQFQFGLIVGNPPFSLAQSMIEKAIPMLADGGYLAFLLRLAFTGSQKRIEFWKQYPPAHIRVFSCRPSFTGDGVTDRGQEYALFTWRGGDDRFNWNSRKTELSWDATNREEVIE